MHKSPSNPFQFPSPPHRPFVHLRRTFRAMARLRLLPAGSNLSKRDRILLLRTPAGDGEVLQSVPRGATQLDDEIGGQRRGSKHSNLPQNLSPRQREYRLWVQTAGRGFVCRWNANLLPPGGSAAGRSKLPTVSTGRQSSQRERVSAN